MPKVCVFGSYVMDLTCYAPRIPTLGETVLAESFAMGPGGKGFNQAVAVTLAGVEAHFISMIGDDDFKPFVISAFERFGLAQDYMFESSDEPTGVALITVEQELGDNSIVVAAGACDALTPLHVQQSEAAFIDANVFLTQFEVNLEATYEAIRMAQRHGAKVILNTAPYRQFDQEILTFVDILVSNQTECSQLVGKSINSQKALEAAANELSAKVSTVIITLGGEGVYCPQVSDAILPAYAVNSVDTTGAGDAFTGIFAAYLARGESIEESIHYAQVGAAISTTINGTAPSMPVRSVIEAARQSRGGA